MFTKWFEHIFLDTIFHYSLLVELLSERNHKLISISKEISLKNTYIISCYIKIPG